MTKKEAINNLRNSLENAGFIEADMDARLLMEYIAGVTRNELFIRGDEELPLEKWNELSIALDKRLKHIPLQYITGYQNFMGLEFRVNEHVLIPRQDTEILVEEVIKQGFSGLDILDMCTGSGCILLSLLKYVYGCRGVGVDISEKALEVAKNNSKELDIPATLIQSDLFDNIDSNEKFDVIVSNPPYIKTDVISGLMEEVRDHEPMLALDGDYDGLKFYRKITEKSVDYLRIGGMLFFEIGYDQGEDVVKIMENEGFEEIRIVKDLSGLDRVVVGTRRNYVR